MNVTKIIQEELGQMLEKDGFQSDFKKNIWTYEREKNGVRQEITILTDRYNKKYLKVLFGTNAYGQAMKGFVILYQKQVQNAGSFGDIKMRMN